MFQHLSFFLFRFSFAISPSPIFFLRLSHELVGEEEEEAKNQNSETQSGCCVRAYYTHLSIFAASISHYHVNVVVHYIYIFILISRVAYEREKQFSVVHKIIQLCTVRTSTRRPHPRAPFCSFSITMCMESVCE